MPATISITNTKRLRSTFRKLTAGTSPVKEAMSWVFTNIMAPSVLARRGSRGHVNPSRQYPPFLRLRTDKFDLNVVARGTKGELVGQLCVRPSRSGLWCTFSNIAQFADRCHGSGCGDAITLERLGRDGAPVDSQPEGGNPG